MKHIAFGFVLLSACGLPSPRSPLTMTPSAAQPPRPSIESNVPPPSFPRVDAEQLPGTKLWFVQQPGTGLTTFHILTRRGNDGAYSDESMRSMIFTLAQMLEGRLPGYEVGAHLDSETVSLSVVVRSADAAQTLRMIAQVLDGPLDGAIARRMLRVDHYRPVRADFVRPHLYDVPAEPELLRSAEALTECRNERFASSDRLITLIGDFDRSEVRAAATESFASAHDYPRAPPSALRSTLPDEVVVTQRTRGQFEATIALRIPSQVHGDADALLVLFVLLSRQLDIMASEHTGVLTPTVFSRMDANLPTRVGMFGVYGAQQNAGPLLVALFRHARAFTARPFDVEEVKRARAQLWQRAQLNADSDPSCLLAEAFVRRLTPNELEARYQALESLTPDELLATARRYFAPERMIVFVGLPSRRRPRLNIVREESGFRLVQEVH